MKDAAVLAAFENDREALENLISQLQDVRFYKITWENGKLIPEANFEAAQILFCKFGLVHSPDLGESSDCMLR
jgi:hypothetical protein